MGQQQSMGSMGSRGGKVSDMSRDVSKRKDTMKMWSALSTEFRVLLDVVSTTGEASRLELDALPSSRSTYMLRQKHAEHLRSLEALQRAFKKEISENYDDDGIALQQQLQDSCESLLKRHSADKAALVTERDLLVKTRAALLTERARGDRMVPDEIVTLNVGGVRYETSRATLSSVPGSLLSSVSSNSGEIFLDRDGAKFGPILDFLRNPYSTDLARSADQGMVAELRFLGLEKAVFRRLKVELKTFTPGPALLGTRSWCTAIQLNDQRVLVLGGDDDDDDDCKEGTTEILDLSKMSFEEGPATRRACCGAAIVRLDSRRAMLLGGHDSGGFCKTTEILDLDTLSFTPGPEMTSARGFCSCVALNGTILVVGGCSNSGSYLSTTETLDLSTMLFRPGPEMLEPRGGCAVFCVDAGRAMVVGGYDGDKALATSEILDLRTMSFQHGPPLPSRRGRWISQAVKIDARLCLLIGGGGPSDSEEQTTTLTELLDLETMEFAGGPAMWCGDRSGPAALGLTDGRILVVGGGEHGDLRTELLDNDDDDLLAVPKGRRRSASHSSSREKKIQKGGFFPNLEYEEEKGDASFTQRGPTAASSSPPSRQQQ